MTRPHGDPRLKIIREIPSSAIRSTFSVHEYTLKCGDGCKGEACKEYPCFGYAVDISGLKRDGTPFTPRTVYFKYTSIAEVERVVEDVRRQRSH